jgi:hypothetical protein
MTSGSKMEISVDLSVLGTLDNPMMLVESTDWSGIGDLPPPIDMGTRSGGRDGTRGADSPKVLHGDNAETVTSGQLIGLPILNGECDFPSGEYAGATVVDKPNYRLYVGHGGGRVWICVVFHDTTNDGNFDYAEVMLDTTHNGTNFPQIDDRHTRIASGSNAPLSRRGDGTQWIPCDAQCAAPPDRAQGSFYNGYENYEFNLNKDNVWATGHDEAGFAIHMYNATNSFNDYWGATNVDINKPSTWGHLDIPEFPAIMVPILIVVAVGRLWRKRRLA